MACAVKNCSNHYSMNKNISYHMFPHPGRELERFKKWIVAINNPKVAKKHPMLIYNQNRVCRKHFDSTCFNGNCKRLLTTAVPKLHLTNDKKRSKIDNSILKINSIDYRDLPRKYFRTNTDKIILNTELFSAQSKNAGAYNEEDEVFDEDNYEIEVLPEEEQDQEDEERLDSNIEVGYENDEEMNCINDFDKDVANIKFETLDNEDDLDEDEEYVIMDLIDLEEHELAPLSTDNFQKWRKEFYQNPKNELAQNICSRVDPFEVCISRKAVEKTNHFFNYKIETEGKPITNQKSSGRCWLFAALNVVRIPFMKEYKLDEFEFSQGYLFYWDKIERCYYFLNNIVEATKRGEEVDGRLISFLLKDPTCDGGQWTMLSNLINKYGLIPKKCFPETFSCEASAHMNAILKSKLREYAKILHEASKSDGNDIKGIIQSQMKHVYNIVGICLGIPPDTFTWEYYSDKSKEYKKLGPISPVDFYKNYVKPVFNVDEKICLVTDPRATNPYGHSFTIDCLGNVVGGDPVIYNNQPVETLLELTKTSLKNGEPVWFGCEVMKRNVGKLGVEDLDIYDFKLVFDVDIQVTLSKADRLCYGDSAMDHAMVFTACSVDENDKPTKFRVENSWGEDRGEKGYLVMTADWFKEFVFEIIVDKSIVPKDVMKVFSMPPTVLPAWDPMGTLA